MVVVRVIGRKEVRETWPSRRSEKVLAACTATRCALEAGLRVELRGVKDEGTVGGECKSGRGQINSRRNLRIVGAIPRRECRGAAYVRTLASRRHGCPHVQHHFRPAPPSIDPRQMPLLAARQWPVLKRASAVLRSRRSPLRSYTVSPSTTDLNEAAKQRTIHGGIIIPDSVHAHVRSPHFNRMPRAYDFIAP